MAEVDKTELLKIKSQLDKALEGEAENPSRAQELLEYLATIVPTNSLLGATRITGSIKKGRKHASDAVKAAAKAVSAKWREVLGAGAAPSTPGTPSSTGAPSVASSDSLQILKAAPVVDEDGKPLILGDSVRDMVRGKFCTILSSDLTDEDKAEVIPDDPDFAVTPLTPGEAAVMLEGAMMDKFKEPSVDYRDKFRMLFSNLKANGALRARILHQDLDGETLCKLKHEELATRDRQEVLQEIKKKGMLLAQQHHIAKNQNVATTDNWKCGKCGQRKCTYYQMQTRSADEPMTCFIRCVVCGNRWKQC